MTIWVKQHQIFQLIATALVPLDDVVDVPPRIERNQLLAHRAALFLGNPEAQRFPFAFVRVPPGVFQSFLEVHLVYRIVRIGFRSDFGMPLDRNIAGIQQGGQFSAGMNPGEYPTT